MLLSGNSVSAKVKTAMSWTLSFSLDCGSCLLLAKLTGDKSNVRTDDFHIPNFSPLVKVRFHS